MKFLIIYEQVPERTQIYKLDTGDNPELTQKLLACHRNLIGVVGIPPEIEHFLCALDLDEIAVKIFDTEDPDAEPPMIDGTFRLIVTGQMM